MLRLMIKQDGRVGRKAEPRPGPSVRGEAAQRKNDSTGRCVRSGNRGCEKSRRPLLRKLLAGVEAHREDSDREVRHLHVSETRGSGEAAPRLELPR